MNPYSKKIKKPWGGEVIITSPDQDRVGKIISINKGERLSFQYHDQKEETLALVSGEALIWLEEDGEIKKINMEAGSGFFIPVGKKHRIEAIKDSIIFEVSSPEKGTTFRIEDDYNRQKESKEDREKQRSVKI